ncbi:MBL fold metallo-hydrolase [Patescibacteria group bacterium]|nr:MBL fold metallo-hydrolase [Patescibacteria group bacterium]
MAEVKVIVTGYTSNEAGSEQTCPTITLIRDKGTNIVCDPGLLTDQKILIDALQREKLSLKDISYVFLTHSHLDHFRNIGMFPQAKTIEYFGIWDKNTVCEWREEFSKDIQIIKTPGHDKTSLTLLVKTKEGIVAVCGDVFWKENEPVQDVYADNEKELVKSRKKVLMLADWVIPGHGRMFKTK